MRRIRTKVDVTAFLKRRRRRLFALAAFASLAAGAVAVEQIRTRHGLDVGRFDRARVKVLSPIDANAFRARLSGSETEIDIALLGVDVMDADAVVNRLAGSEVSIKLDPLHPRDASGRLFAYVYVTDADMLNADLIEFGQAYADRRYTHPFASMFGSLEADARKRERGVWKDHDDAAMPAWRREWLSAQARRR